MTKDELVGVVAENILVSKKEAKDVTEELFATIKRAMKNGDSVTIRGFGTFQMKHRAEKKARIISKGETIVIPERDVPTFKASKQFFE